MPHNKASEYLSIIGSQTVFFMYVFDEIKKGHNGDPPVMSIW